MATLGQKILLMVFSMGVVGLAVYAACGMSAISGRYRDAIRRLRRRSLSPRDTIEADDSLVEFSLARDIWHCFSMSLVEHVNDMGETIPLASPQEVLKLRTRLGSGMDYLWRKERSLAGHIVTMGFAGTLALASRGAFMVLPLLVSRKPRMPLAVHDLFQAFGAALALMTFALTVMGTVAIFEYLMRQSLGAVIDELLTNIRGGVLLSPPRTPETPPMGRQAPTLPTAGIEQKLEALQRDVQALSRQPSTGNGPGGLRQMEWRLPEDQLQALTSRLEAREWRLPADQLRALVETREWRLPEDQLRVLTSRPEGQEWRLPEDQLRDLKASREWRLPDDQLQALRECRLSTEEWQRLTSAKESIPQEAMLDAVLAAQEKFQREWRATFETMMQKQAAQITTASSRAGVEWRQAMVEVSRQWQALNEGGERMRTADQQRLVQTDEILRQFDQTSHRFLRFLEDMERRDEDMARAEKAAMTPVASPSVTTVAYQAVPSEFSPASALDENQEEGMLASVSEGGFHDQASPDLGPMRLRAGIALMKELWQELGMASEGMAILREQLSLLQHTWPGNAGTASHAWLREAKRAFLSAEKLSPPPVLSQKMLSLLRGAWHEGFDRDRLLERDGVAFYHFFAGEGPVTPASASESFWTQSPIPAQAALAMIPVRKAMASSLRAFLEAQTLIAHQGGDSDIDAFGNAMQRTIRSLYALSEAWEGWHGLVPSLKAFLHESLRRLPEAPPPRRLAS